MVIKYTNDHCQMKVPDDDGVYYYGSLLAFYSKNQTVKVKDERRDSDIALQARSGPETGQVQASDCQGWARTKLMKLNSISHTYTPSDRFLPRLRQIFQSQFILIL